jgi:YidC/Oxa1 family membrane protein insertase
MENIRFLLVITFAMLVLLLQQAWQADYGPKPVVEEVITDVNSRDDMPAAIKAETSLPQPTTVSSPIMHVAEHSSAKIIKVTTDVLGLEINSQGGTIQNLDLLAYPVEQDNTVVNKLREMIGLTLPEKNKSPIRLFTSEPDSLFLAQSGLIPNSGSIEGANHHSIFTASQQEFVLSAGQETLTVPLVWVNENGLQVTKTFVFRRGSYEIDLNQTVKNTSGAPWTGRQYSQLLKTPNKKEQGNMLTSGMRAYDGGVVYTQANKYQKINFDDMHDKNLDVVTLGGWSAMIQHYFATAWVPPAITIEANNEASFNAKLFAGPKIQTMMENTAPGLELTVDYSVLTFIGKPIYWLLNQINQLVDNWGLAIIGVTFSIKLLFFPLSQSSFKSMAKMRKIQPRLKELQERFKDDRQRFNTEMMSLYRKEKVNPLGGCLPILVQIPVFMALYWVLSETVEFRQAPFMLWIQDLSIQDPFFVLPIIMGISMKVQQSLNPAPIDPIQAKVIRMFPIVFTVFFLFFPAGLVLYWIINNTLSIIQQTYITKQIDSEK